MADVVANACSIVDGGWWMGRMHGLYVGTVSYGSSR